MQARRRGIVVAIAALVAASVAPVSAQDPVVQRIRRVGSHKDYGRGIVAASLRRLQFELGRKAHVIVVRVHPDGGIEPLLPRAASPPTESAEGTHLVDAPPTAANASTLPLEHVLTLQGLERVAQEVRLPVTGSEEDDPSPAAYWWLLIVADVPTTSDELASFLTNFAKRSFPSVQAEVRALPRDLVGKRAQRWAAYFVPVE